MSYNDEECEIEEICLVNETHESHESHGSHGNIGSSGASNNERESYSSEADHTHKHKDILTTEENSDDLNIGDILAGKTGFDVDDPDKLKPNTYKGGESLGLFFEITKDEENTRNMPKVQKNNNISNTKSQAKVEYYNGKEYQESETGIWIPQKGTISKEVQSKESVQANNLKLNTESNLKENLKPIQENTNNKNAKTKINPNYKKIEFANKQYFTENDNVKYSNKKTEKTEKTEETEETIIEKAKKLFKKLIGQNDKNNGKDKDKDLYV